jgi:hypothetical protein
MRSDVEKVIHSINNYIYSTGAVIAEICGDVHTEEVTVYGIVPADSKDNKGNVMELITLGSPHHTFLMDDVKAIEQLEDGGYKIIVNNTSIVLKG